MGSSKSDVRFVGLTVPEISTYVQDNRDLQRFALLLQKSVLSFKFAGFVYAFTAAMEHVEGSSPCVQELSHSVFDVVEEVATNSENYAEARAAQEATAYFTYLEPSIIRSAPEYTELLALAEKILTSYGEHALFIVSTYVMGSLLSPRSPVSEEERILSEYATNYIDEIWRNCRGSSKQKTTAYPVGLFGHMPIGSAD